MSTGISACFCTEIERNDPLAEQGDNLLTEGRGKDFAAFVGRQALDAEQQFSKANGREVKALAHLRVKPREHVPIGLRTHRLGDYVGIEQDHARASCQAAFLRLPDSRR